MFLAFFAENWHRLFGGHTVLTKFIVRTVTMEQWYSCEKVRPRLCVVLVSGMLTTGLVGEESAWI